MIRVNIERERGSRLIIGFRVEGHALFAEHGQDIVCAGVSAVAVGTINAAEAVAGVVLPNRMEPGVLHASLPDGLTDAELGNVQLLLESMVVMLQTIERSYENHIRLKDQYK